MLAEKLAKGIDAILIQWHIKSASKAQQGLSGLRDSQLGSQVEVLSIGIIMHRPISLKNC